MLDENKLKKFAAQIIQAYKRQSILGQIANVIDFSAAYERKDFFQIAEAVSLPKEFFYSEDDVDNSFLAGDFARSIVFGEQNFILSQLLQKANRSEIQSHNIEKFSYLALIDIIRKAYVTPTDIFIPIDLSYWNEVHDWLYKGRAKYEDDHQLYILVGNDKIRVHWSTKAIPFNDIFFIDRNGLRIVQKKFEDMIEPTWLGNILFKYGQKEPLRLDFAQSEDQDKFRFYFRSVIAIDSVDKNTVGFIKLPESNTPTF